MLFLFIVSFFLNASKYLDFVDSLYYEKFAEYAKSYEILDNLTKQDNDRYLYYRKYDVALKGYRTNQLGVEKLEENVEKIVEFEPDKPDNWLLYGAVKLQQQKIVEAQKAYENVIKLDPKNVEAYYQLAIISSSDTAKSLSYFRKIIEINPSLAGEVYYNIAVLYSLKNDTKKVEEYIEKAIKEDPSSIKPYYFLAFYWEEKGNFQKTLEIYKRIINIEPDNVNALTKIAELYLSTSNYSMAQSYFEKVIEYDPQNKKALWWLALIEENSKRYDKAISYISRIDKWQDDIDLVLKMSYYWIMLGSMDKTIGILEEAYKKWPNNAAISYYLGLGMMDLEKYNEAKKYFEVVLSTQPDRYEVRYNLGVICEKINDVECFKKHFGYLLIKYPDDASVLNYLGYSLVDRDIIDEEVIVDSISVGTPFDMIKKAVDKEPQNYAYLDSLGWYYFKKKDYKKALEYIEKSIELMKKGGLDIDPLILEHKADILSATGSYDEAYLLYTQSYISDTLKRRSIISLSALNTLQYVSPILLIENIKKMMPLFFEASGEIKVNADYKKFLFRKKFKYTFSSIFKSNLTKKEFDLKILGPLFTPVVEIYKNDRDLNISSFTSEQHYRNLVKNAFLALIGFTSLPSILDSHTVLYKNGFVFKDVFEKGDSLLVRYEENPFVPDCVEYINGDQVFKLKIINIFDDKLKKFMPSNIVIQHHLFSIEINFDNNKNDNY